MFRGIYCGRTDISRQPRYFHIMEKRCQGTALQKPDITPGRLQERSLILLSDGIAGILIPAGKLDISIQKGYTDSNVSGV